MVGVLRLRGTVLENIQRDRLRKRHQFNLMSALNKLGHDPFQPGTTPNGCDSDTRLLAMVVKEWVGWQSVLDMLDSGDRITPVISTGETASLLVAHDRKSACALLRERLAQADGISEAAAGGLAEIAAFSKDEGERSAALEALITAANHGTTAAMEELGKNLSGTFEEVNGRLAALRCSLQEAKFPAGVMLAGAVLGIACIAGGGTLAGIALILGGMSAGLCAHLAKNIR